MEQQTKTKKALIMSVLSVFLCIAMLIGMTFAWFTDTASTGVNKIQAGNLKMKVEYSKDMTSWTEVAGDKAVFDENALWEPGRTEVVYFRVSNIGNLAFRYNFDTAVSSYSPGINADGDEIDLRDYLMLGSTDTASVFSSREAAINAVNGNAKLVGSNNTSIKKEKVMDPGETSGVFALVLYMPTTVGNEANNVDKSRTPEIELGITVNATQATVESDSFGTDYDADAPKVFKSVTYYSGTHTITDGVMAPGRWGAVQVTGGTTTIEASVTATAKNDTAMAVWASGGSVIINSGTFTQQGLGNSDHYDLIYASDGGKIIINGGKFKAKTPQWTLNCKDGSGSTITVKGGTFYKFDPSNANTGAGEIIVPSGYSVVKNGDWYTVIGGTVVSNETEFATALTNATEGSKIILNCDITSLNLADDITVADGIIIDGQNKFSISLNAWMALSNLSITIQNAQMG